MSKLISPISRLGIWSVAEDGLSSIGVPLLGWVSVSPPAWPAKMIIQIMIVLWESRRVWDRRVFIVIASQWAHSTPKEVCSKAIILPLFPFLWDYPPKSLICSGLPSNSWCILTRAGLVDCLSVMAGAGEACDVVGSTLDCLGWSTVTLCTTPPFDSCFTVAWQLKDGYLNYPRR